MTIILKIIRWIIAAAMWFMALGSLLTGGLGIIGAILFVIVGIMISPLSSKYIFSKLPNLKKSHKITSVAVIWLAANVFLGLSPAATKTNNADKAMSTAAVSEASVESVDRSMADVSTVEASEEDIVVAETSTDASIETSSNSSIEEKSVESADKNKKSTASSTATTAKSTKTTSVASTGSTTESATTETKANSDAENTVAEQKAAEDTAAQQASEEAAAQKAAEEAAAQQAAEEAAAQKAAEETAAQQASEAAVAQQPDSSTVANGTESANALKVLQMGPTTGDVCWVPRNGGTKYHTRSTCSGMDDPICTTVDTAEACGFEPCKHCH